MIDPHTAEHCVNGITGQRPPIDPEPWNTLKRIEKKLFRFLTEINFCVAEPNL